MLLLIRMFLVLFGVVCCWDSSTWAAPTEQAQAAVNASPSYFNVKQRQNELLKIGLGRLQKRFKLDDKKCDASRPFSLQPLSAVLPNRYLTGTTKVDPDYRAAIPEFNRVEDCLAWWSNSYMMTGKADQAIAVLDLLKILSETRWLLGPPYQHPSQNWYQSAWSLTTSAIALSIVRHEPALSPDTIGNVENWMREAVGLTISVTAQGQSCCNNQRNWRALAAVAVGKLVGDVGLMQRGFEDYRKAIRDLGPNGEMDLELRRENQELFYQGFAIAPLVLIAEYAHSVGIELHEFQHEGRSLAKAVE